MERDVAIAGLPTGKLLVGWGPFEEFEQCPRDGVAFYVNDFSLSEGRPWKVPAEFEVVDQYVSDGSEELNVSWNDLPPNGFAEVFSEINQAIRKGAIEKSVPVATEVGVIESGSATSLLASLGERRGAYYPYAWVQGERGFCGVTPELLFHLRKGRLKTMALAGTARAEDRAVFAFDEKEIREHEYVAQTLVASLSDIGMVKRSVRQVMDLGTMVHFHTPIEVFMYGDYPVEQLVRKMHPTPALGPHPRTAEALSELMQWREQLNCPDYFGAPFGAYYHGEFHALVAIRGLHWQADQLLLPSGCGVIEASRLTNEWQELALKRAAVKQKFGV